MDKFEIIESGSIRVKGIVLHRIRALIDFWDVRAGELGWYIQKKKTYLRMAMRGFTAMRGFSAMRGLPEMRGLPINIVLCGFPMLGLSLAH